MSNSLQNKMHEYEVSPPKGVWDTIALALDETAAQKNLSDNLYGYEATPPSNIWNKIADSLDQDVSEDILREKIVSLEVPPPVTTWNKITAELDNEFGTVSEKILQYEVAPPYKTWQNITATLDAEQAPVIPIKKSYSKILRLAAAAVVIGFLAWGGFSLLNNKTENIADPIASNEIKTIPPTTTITTDDSFEKTAPIDDIKPDGIKPVITKVKEKRTITAPVTTVKSNPRGTTRSVFGNEDELSTEEGHTSSNDIASTDINNFHKKNKPAVATADGNNTEARYLVYLTDKGDMVKLSKKLADMKCIYNKDGSVSQDAMAALDAAECNDQLKYWQEKVANSSLQSASNPLELISILK